MLRDSPRVKCEKLAGDALPTTHPMTLYRLCLVLKLSGVMLYAGGMVASFVATDVKQRRFAVHRLASVGIGMIWVFGYVLTQLLMISPLECWILSGFLASFHSNFWLVRSLRKPVSTRSIVLCTFPFVAGLVLMVFRPTWAMIFH